MHAVEAMAVRLSFVGCANPEEAATSGIPVDAVKVLDAAVSPEGKHAVVLIAAGDPSIARIFEILCVLGPEGWDEVSDHESPGWTWVPDRDLNVSTEWAANGTETSGFRSVDWNAPEPPAVPWPSSGPGGPTW